MAQTKNTKKSSSKSSNTGLLQPSHKMSIVLAAVFVCVLTATGIGIRLYSNAATYGGQQMDTYDAQMLTLINNARAANGKATLSIQGGLQNGARSWSYTLANANTIYHDMSAWNTVAGCSWWGEIIVQNSISVQSAFNQYMSDPAHKAIVLGDYHYVGSGTTDRSASSPADHSTRWRFNVVRFARTCTTKTATILPWANTAVAPPAAGTTSYLATYEGIDKFTYAAHWGTGINSTLAWPTFTTGDDPVKITVSNTVLGAIGAGGLLARKAQNFAKVARVNVRISHNLAGKIIPVNVYLVDPWVGTYTIGTINATSTATTYALTVPAGAKYYANHIRISTTGPALAKLSTSLASQKATFNIYSISTSN